MRQIRTCTTTSPVGSQTSCLPLVAVMVITLDDLTARLLRWVQESADVPATDRSGSGTPLAVGQVRRLDPVIGDEGDSRLVLLLQVFLDSRGDLDVALVALVQPDPALATRRDVVLPAALLGTDGDRSVMTDAVASVWVEQLAGRPVHGQVDPEIADLVAAAHVLPDEELRHRTIQLGLHLGSVITKPDDSLWRYRENEAEALSRLSHDCVMSEHTTSEIVSTAERISEAQGEPMDVNRDVAVLVGTLSRTGRHLSGDRKRAVLAAIHPTLHKMNPDQIRLLFPAFDRSVASSAEGKVAA